ncbi:MAG TPA: hypothetical protein VMS21_05365, partial [Methylomirabilota bacterium]|nr:hypothetical protein [Methylomirabilota bacterium]
MNFFGASWLAVLPALVFLCPANPAQGQSDPPSFVRNQFVSAGFFLALIDPVTNQWTRIEVSSDLNGWSELVNLYATDDCCSSIYIDDTARDVDRRFYRVMSPGTTVQEARARWESLSVNSY